jgi:hypothetical protein
LQVQSQLHGEYLFQPTVPISTHRLYTLDWTPYLAPGDAPSLTAVTLRPMPTGVAVSQLELCVHRGGLGDQPPVVQVAFTPRSERAMMRRWIWPVPSKMS